MALPITLPDGRQVIPPDDLSEEELELFKTDFTTKFPVPMPEEDIADPPGGRGAAASRCNFMYINDLSYCKKRNKALDTYAMPYMSVL